MQEVYYRQLIQQCQDLGEFISFETTPEWVSCYERDAQSLHTQSPLFVFRPHRTASIPPFMQRCHQLDLPVTVRCGGTGLVGGCIASTQGVILLTGHLKQIAQYDSKKGTLCLEPGVTIRQLNRYVESDHWCFPLSIATEGVAGLAGCLSCHTRGYHQQERALYEGINSVVLVDGQGEVIEVPSQLVCGAEGLWGVIIKMNMQLKRRSSVSREFVYAASWPLLLEQLSSLRSLHALTFILWSDDQFYLGLEGEEWRLPSTCTYLSQLLKGIKPISESAWKARNFFVAYDKQFVMLSSAFQSVQLPEACQWAVESAEQLGLNCRMQADVLAGSLHLVLQTEKDDYAAFSEKITPFLILWADFVDRQQGILGSCHGIGRQMHPYMTPFWSEETQRMLKRMQSAFDPKGQLSKERFFPLVGESLEKVGLHGRS